MIVLKEPYLAPFGARYDDVADLECPSLDENRCDRSAATIELCFDHRAFAAALWVRLQIEEFGLKQNRFLELVEIGALGCRDFDSQCLATHVFDLDLMLQKFALDARRVGI